MCYVLNILNTYLLLVDYKEPLVSRCLIFVLVLAEIGLSNVAKLVDSIIIADVYASSVTIFPSYCCYLIERSL